MSDNVLKATIEAIAESDNELGGLLMTRLKEAHIFGQNDAVVEVGQDDLVSLVDVFTSGMVGREVDILAKPALTGNEGRYLISVIVDSKTATLTTLLGGAIAFVAGEDPVVWRFGDLRVETTYEFLNPPTDTDPVGKLWVGLEDKIVTYVARDLIPGAHRFTQLGDYLTGAGYLTKNHREDSVVIDGRRGYSAIDKFRRAMLVVYATEEELDRIGRNMVFSRPLAIGDEIYRNLLQTVPFGPRGTAFILELALGALYPTKSISEVRGMIYEDLVKHPCTVYFDLPDTELGSIFEGRTFMNPAGRIDGSGIGRWGREEDETEYVTAFSTIHEPVTIAGVYTRPVEGSLAMAVLPTANDPAWTYSNQGAVEGATFSIEGDRKSVV